MSARTGPTAHDRRRHWRRQNPPAPARSAQPVRAARAHADARAAAWPVAHRGAPSRSPAAENMSAVGGQRQTSIMLLIEKLLMSWAAQVRFAKDTLSGFT